MIYSRVEPLRFRHSRLPQHVLLAVLILCLALCGGCDKTTPTTAIAGATVINLTQRGAVEDDLEDAIVLVQGDSIVAVGARNEIDIPSGAHIIDATGKYIVPGLIDGFAAINNQAYANAYLYMGVTSIVAVSGGRRGELFTDADPGPHLHLLGDVGWEETVNDELVRQVDSLATGGIDVLLMMYRLRPEQLKLVVERAHGHTIATIGELGFAPYADGIEAGIDAFVHTTRYSLDIAPAEMRAAVAEQPFSDELYSPKWRYYKYLSEVDLDDALLQRHSKALGGGGTFVMPTMSLLYLDLPEHNNPWHEPVAAILDAADINNPADRETGNHDYDTAHLEAYRALAVKELELEALYHKAGAAYLAGSATDVWGTMPGISLHTELELLHRVGLTNREALAAATTNFAEAYNWNHTGQIKPGCVADILVLDENPVDDLTNLKMIDRLFLAGTEIDRVMLLGENR